MAQHEDHMRHVAEGHAEESDMGVEHTHPTPGLYIKIGAILTVITAVEVAAYYIPAWVNSWVFVPSLLAMSAVKFVMVVMFYMHLKFDHRLFRVLFSGPLIVAAVTIIALMFLFGQLAVRTGALS